MPIGIIRIVRSFGHRQLYDDYNRTKEGAIAVEYIVMDMEWNQALTFSEMVKDPVFLTGEIIQIGAIKLNQTLEVVDSFNERIAPQYYTELHPKVAEITKLSNRDLQKGKGFHTVFNSFCDWCGDDFVFLVWGTEDLRILRKNMDLHNIDTVRGTGSDLDKLAADLIAGSTEFVSLDGRQNVALNAAHPHPKSQKLHGEGLACARCAQQVQVGIFIYLCVEQIHDAQGVVVSVDAQQHAIVVRQLKAGEDIAGCGAAGQHIALRLFLKLGRDFQERHHRLQCGLLLKAALAGVHIHGFEHIHHLLLAPKQFLVGFGRYGDENAHVKEVLVVVGDAILDKIARLYGIGQLLIIGAGILHALELGAVEPDPLGDLIYGAAAVLTAEMDVDLRR